MAIDAERSPAIGSAAAPAPEAAADEPSSGEPVVPEALAGEAHAEGSPSAQRTLELLAVPREGTPQPLTTPDELAKAAAGLAAGTGPVAIDAERASGYRYSQRAYLVQLRRAGYGTVLIDPIPLPDLTAIGSALKDAEWIVHAATQDLPCLAELGMRPSALFDSELAGRLLGFERVALGTMVEQYLGVGLEKGHSAADWSTRPLPSDWLAYAALDVELLIELRTVLVAELERAGKSDWAQQEFAAILAAPAPAPRADPWRRTSGIHSIRSPRRLAMVRALWLARDELAAQRDIAPGRVLPDSAIVAAVKANPQTQADLTALPVFNGPRQRRLAGYWFAALLRGRDLPDAELPPLAQALTDADAMPTVSRWRERDPDAANRLVAVKAAVADLAQVHQVLAQNLLAGELVRRLSWSAIDPLNEDAVRIRLSELGARPWQTELAAERLTEALTQARTEQAPASGELPSAPDIDGYGAAASDVTAAVPKSSTDATEWPGT